MIGTVRALVADIAREVRTGDLQPARSRELLMTLTSLIGNCTVEEQEADAEYAVVLLRHLDGEEAANRAKIRAETTPEYKRKQIAHGTTRLVVEMIRTLKICIRSISDEMQLGSR